MSKEQFQELEFFLRAKIIEVLRVKANSISFDGHIDIHGQAMNDIKLVPYQSNLTILEEKPEIVKELKGRRKRKVDPLLVKEDRVKEEVDSEWKYTYNRELFESMRGYIAQRTLTKSVKTLIPSEAADTSCGSSKFHKGEEKREIKRQINREGTEDVNFMVDPVDKGLVSKDSYMISDEVSEKAYVIKTTMRGNDIKFADESKYGTHVYIKEGKEGTETGGKEISIVKGKRLSTTNILQKDLKGEKTVVRGRRTQGERPETSKRVINKPVLNTKPKEVKTVKGLFGVPLGSYDYSSKFITEEDKKDDEKKEDAKEADEGADKKDDNIEKKEEEQGQKEDGTKTDNENKDNEIVEAKGESGSRTVEEGNKVDSNTDSEFSFREKGNKSQSLMDNYIMVVDQGYVAPKESAGDNDAKERHTAPINKFQGEQKSTSNSNSNNNEASANREGGVTPKKEETLDLNPQEKTQSSVIIGGSGQGEISAQSKPDEKEAMLSSAKDTKKDAVAIVSAPVVVKKTVQKEKNPRDAFVQDEDGDDEDVPFGDIF
mmetsp:Transcript_14752/g.15254  ORF Transcript_14752/g.15254 Transcript_14752/m.15254 type:complete len:544 (+) Transcript_14752:1-1632(+)